MQTASFTHRYVPALKKEVFRLGLACNYGIDATGFDRAMERGVNYIFYTAFRTSHLKESIRRALRQDREKRAFVTGPSFAFLGGNVRRGAERALREFGIDYIDVFQLFWLGKTSAWTLGTISELQKLKEEGKVRAIGISIHDRERAGRLVLDSPLDLYMLRYNAAHPGCERDVFPHLPAGEKRPAVVAYTATSWRSLLKAPGGWKGNVMTAGDCYRFCLSNPNVDITLTGPKNWQQLEESLAAIEKGPLTPEEESWMRAFGRTVHG